MKFRWCQTFLAALFLAGCSGASAASEPPQEIAATSPFVLQFSGVYEDRSAAAGTVSWLQIHRDGSFDLKVQGMASSDHGKFAASVGHELPATLELYADSLGTLPAMIVDYDGLLHVSYDGKVSSLKATSPVGPHEALCDATHGKWFDDSPDPVTGLQCVCRASEAYVPSEGGCVR